MSASTLCVPMNANTKMKLTLLAFEVKFRPWRVSVQYLLVGSFSATLHMRKKDTPGKMRNEK